MVQDWILEPLTTLPDKKRLGGDQPKRSGASVLLPTQYGAMPDAQILEYRNRRTGRCYNMPRFRMRRVLIIEDEPLVREVFTSILQRRGFKVFHAGPCCKPDTVSQCGLQCLGNVRKPDLVIVAVVTPRSCSGVEAAMSALRRWPGTKVLLTSATPKPIWPRPVANLFDSLPPDKCAFLPKPFRVSDLFGAVDALLGSTSGNQPLEVRRHSSDLPRTS